MERRQRRAHYSGDSRTTRYRRRRENIVPDSSSESDYDPDCNSESTSTGGVNQDASSSGICYKQFEAPSSDATCISNVHGLPRTSVSNRMDCNTNDDGALSSDTSSCREVQPSPQDAVQDGVLTCASESERSSEEEDEDIAFSSDLESLQVHFLEEEPRAHDEEQLHQEGGLAAEIAPAVNERNPAPPDDPDNPDSDSENSDSSDDDGENIHPQVADLAHENLNVPVALVQNITKGEVILMELAAGVRHKNTFIRVLESFRNLNVLCGARFFPESKSKLWSIIRLDTAGIQRHVYCGAAGCGLYIGRRDRLGQISQCTCGYQIQTSKAKFFVTLNVANQILYLLSIPGIREQLRYRETRRKLSPTAIEDVFDGAQYHRLQQPGEPLADPNNYSYFFNLDGLKFSKKGQLKVFPVYMRINELPPEMRQKFRLLAAVYVDTVDPNFLSFMKPFVAQANILSTRGISWKPDGVNEITSKFIPIGHCVDSPVRCGVLAMAKWDSQTGCTYCTHEGVRLAGSQRYAFVDVNDLPPIQERTHDGMLADMMQAQENVENHLPRGQVNVRGHKGATQLMLLQNHDLRQGQGVDDLHQDHEGCAKSLTELLLTIAPRVDADMSDIALLRAVDARLLLIKTPSRISRKTRSIKKRGSYSGTEWRNWLFAYGVPCLVGLIEGRYLNIFASLSHACYLLSQDCIEPVDIDRAQRLFLEGVGQPYEELFGVGRIKYNLHVTTSHKANCVRQLGPPWAYSTYNFESLNMKLAKMVTSPKGAAIQIVTRCLLELTVNAAQYDERFCEEVRQRLQSILNKERLQRVQHVNADVYLVGIGEDDELGDEESEVLRREGFQQVQNVQKFKGFLMGNTRFRSLAFQIDDIKSDDTFVYSHQDTFCTIRKVVRFHNGNGERISGAFVSEHAVDRVLPIARHISVLQHEAADLLHFIHLRQVRSPAIRMSINNVNYAVSVPNCYEID